MQLATPASSPYHCFGSPTWDVATAGGGQSVLSGVLAGFVFAGIVAVLGVQATRSGSEASNALKLMFSAFLGLAVAAYLFADQAADSNCLRASSEEVLAGGILGTFVIIMIVSLSWLVAAYQMQENGVLQFLRHLLYVTSLLVVVLLCTSSYSYLQADMPHGPSDKMTFLIYLTGILLYALGLTAMWVVWPLLAKTRRTRMYAHRYRGKENSGGHHKKHSLVDFCNRMALFYLAVAGIGDAFVLSTNDSAWIPPPTDAIRAVAWSSLVVPVAVLILAMHALARESPSYKAGQTSGTASANENVPGEGEAMAKHSAERDEITVILTDEPPQLNPEAAHALLKILLKAYEKQFGHEYPPTAET